MYGTFTRDGRTRVARTPAQAVAFAFDGWKKTEDPEPAAPTAPAVPEQGDDEAKESTE